MNKTLPCLLVYLFAFINGNAQTTFSASELKPDTRVATNYTNWKPITNTNPNGESLVKLYQFENTSCCWGNFYDDCFGYELWHNQHIVRLPNKTDANGDLRAYFMVSQSRGHNGYIEILETKPGVIDTATDEIQTTNNSVAGNIIWQDVYTGTFNGTINPAGNWNHPGKMDVCGGVLVVACENFDPDFCSSDLGTSEDAVLFYDVRDPRDPKFISKLTSTDLGLSAITSLSLQRTHNGEYILNAGNSSNGVNTFGQYRGKDKKIGFTKSDWIKIGSSALTGQHGMEFRALSPNGSGKEVLVIFGARNTNSFSFNAFEYDTTSHTYSDVTTGDTTVGVGGLPGASRDWDAEGLYISEKGVPIVYTAKSLSGTTNVQIYQVTSYEEVVVQLPITNFIQNKDTIVVNECVTFTDDSQNDPYAWNWSFEGGSPSTSRSKQPAEVCYNTAGEFITRLFTVNSAGSNAIEKTIVVKQNASSSLIGTKSFELYPNPTQDIFTIVLSTKESGNISVFDLSGQKVLTQQLVGMKNTINVSKLTNGEYIVSVSTQLGTYTQKLIKQ